MNLVVRISQRTHEECEDCANKNIIPHICDDHPFGPISCEKFKSKWQERDEDPNYIDCIGKDGKKHICYPWADKCYCGEPILRKKLLRKDWR